MGKHLIIGNTDYIRWADISMLNNAVLVAGAGVAEQFSLGLQNYAQMIEGFGGQLPTLPVGHAPVIYLEATGEDTGPPWAEYEILASGILLSVDGSEGSLSGATKINCGTPSKFLKIVAHSIAFYPDEGREPTDTSRIRRLGQIMADQIPDWDLTTFVNADDDGNIHYPLPNLPPRGDSTDADFYTNYPESSLDTIIRAIATDPGCYVDADYPVQARNWWVEGDFVGHSGNPADAVKWYLHYQNVPVPSEVFDLRGAASIDLPDAKLYEQGASYTSDYTKIIRQINIAGPSQSPDGVYQYVPQNISWVGGSDDPPTYTSRSGVVFKYGGTDGVWDTAASSGVADPTDPRYGPGFSYDDFEVDCQLQEVYLEHDTFQRPNGPGEGGGLGVTNHQTQWLDLAAGTPMVVRNGHAASQYLKSPSTGGAAWAFGILDCHGTNVFLRTHLAVNRLNMGLMFRYKDYYNYWIVRTETWGYALYKVIGGTYNMMGSVSMPRADMQEIKVALTNEGDPQIHSYVDVYIDNVQHIHVDDNYQWDYRFHGLSIDCRVLEAYDGEFYDFQCTTFYSDRSFGMGNNDMTLTGHPTPTWALHTFGFIFNSDGTVEICHDGAKIDHADWYLPNMNDYTYNDRFRIITVSYIDPITRSKMRKAQWLKQPDGQGQWYLLIEFAPITEPVGPDPNHHWFAQFCAKDMGAALINCVAGQAYSNMFYAPGPPTHVELWGGNHLYPATGVLQSDTWTNYMKRQRVADGIFKAEADPALTFNCATMWHFRRGDFAVITNKRAGWVDSTGTGGMDTRPTLICVSSQRVDSSVHGAPKYKCAFGQYIYASDDPGRTHLLAPGVIQASLYGNGTMPIDPEFDGMMFSIDQSVISGLDDFGKQLQVQFLNQDQLGEENAQFPTQTYDLPMKRGVIPPTLFPPGSKVYMRYRTVGPGGNSQWSTAAPFVTPPALASDRLSTLMWYIGDGVNAISASGDSAIYDEIIVNQPCKIVGWAADLGNVVGDMEYHIEWCTAADRRANGVTAFTNITGGDGMKIINTPTPINDGTFNDGYAMGGWNAAAFTLNTGDRLRLVVVSASTDATKGTVDLMFAARNVPFAQHSGVPGVGGSPVGSMIVGADGQPLVGADGQTLAGGK